MNRNSNKLDIHSPFLIIVLAVLIIQIGNHSQFAFADWEPFPICFRRLGTFPNLISQIGNVYQFDFADWERLPI